MVYFNKKDFWEPFGGTGQVTDEMEKSACRMKEVRVEHFFRETLLANLKIGKSLRMTQYPVEKRSRKKTG